MYSSSKQWSQETGDSSLRKPTLPIDRQPCPRCGYLIGIVAGSKEAICSNCGFKDPCCE